MNIFAVVLNFLASFNMETLTVKACDNLYDKVWQCNSKFVSHAMLTSDPFTMCTDKAVFAAYRYTMDFYDKLFVMTDPTNASAFYSDERLNKNKMNLIVNYVGQTKTLWETAHCDQCYIDPTSKEQNFTAATEEFLELQFLVASCMTNTSHNFNNSAVCTQCGDDYQRLNIMFDHAMEVSGDKICFDLADKTNKTKCTSFEILKTVDVEDKSLEAAVLIGLTILVNLLGFAFYYYVAYLEAQDIFDDFPRENEITRSARDQKLSISGEGNILSAAD